MSKNVMLLVSSLHSGGAERIAVTLANAWAARGDRVVILATFSGRGGCFYALSSAVQLEYLADRVQYQGRSILAYVNRYFGLRKRIRDMQPDLIVSFLTNVNIATLLAARGGRFPIVISERIYPPMLPVGRMWDVLRRWTYPWAARVVMLTREGVNWLNDEIPRARGVVIPNPVIYPLPTGEPRLPVEAMVGKQRQLILAVGRLDTQKGFDLLLEAFCGLAAKHVGWDLVILGEGPQRGALEAQVGRLGLGHRVSLPGRAGNVGEWYSRADLYVMSSRFEGFPNTLAEAMAHGCAAVSYDCDTGPRDIVRDGVDGLLVKPEGGVPALAEALDRLMTDDAERKRMAARAVGVRERYSMGRILAAWDALFDREYGRNSKAGEKQ